jgi:hypothetical protein
MTGKEYSQQWADECGFTENQLLALDPNCVKHFNAGVLEGRAQLQAANIEKDERIIVKATKSKRPTGWSVNPKNK